MSRHRAVRNQAYYDDDDYDYYDDDDYYEEEEEGDYGEQYAYDRRQASSFGDLFQQNVDRQRIEQEEATHVRFRDSLLAEIGAADWSSVGVTEQEVDEIVRRSGADADAALCAIVSLKEERQAARQHEEAAAREAERAAMEEVQKALAAPLPKAKPPLLPVPRREAPGGSTTPPMSRSSSRSQLGSKSPAPTPPMSRSNSRASLTRTPSPKPSQQSRLESSLEADVASDVEEGEGGSQDLSLVVIGHVDAGKSTLMGRLMLTCREVSKRQIAKFEQECAGAGKSSFQFAWCMDEGEEERSHGVTMDVAQKALRLPSGRVVTVLDAPGHRDFVPQMISGASSADVALLAVPASVGEFEAAFGPGGQTREHALLARGMGVNQVLICVTKLDSHEPAWDSGRYESIIAQTKDFLQSIGFKAKRIRGLPVSGLHGVNMGSDDAPLPPALAAWYAGPTLLEAIEAFQMPQRLVDRPFRLIVDDVGALSKDRVKLSGLCIAGRLRVGQRVAVMPLGDVCQVRKLIKKRPSATAAAEGRGSVYTEGAGNVEEEVERVLGGDYCDVIVHGIEEAARAPPGSVLCKLRRSELCRGCRKIEAQIRTFEALLVPLVKGTQLILHRGGKEVPVTVGRLLALVNGDGEVTKERPRHVTANKTCRLVLRLDDRICLEAYRDCRALGRFALRARGATLAAGIVTEVLK